MAVMVAPVDVRTHADVLPDAGQDRHAKRNRLRILDVCLGQLEDARESGKQDVPRDVAAAFGTYVSGLAPSMPLDRALELVFAEQAKWVTPSRQLTQARGGEPGIASPWDAAAASSPASALTESEARALTEKIRANVQEMCLLLHRAHSCKAWSALGYSTWEAYVASEFSLSRSHSYELLDQARVVLAIQQAAAMPEPPMISARRAARIKPHLDPIVHAIRAMPSPGASAADVVSLIDGLLEVRQTEIARTPTSLGDAAHARMPSARQASGHAVEVPHRGLSIGEMIRCLAELPPATQVARQVAILDLPPPAIIERAAELLRDLAIRCRQARG